MKALTIEQMPKVEGYIRNSSLDLIPWAYAQKIMKQDDGDLYKKYNIAATTEPQRAYSSYCRDFVEKHHRHFRLEECD